MCQTPPIPPAPTSSPRYPLHHEKSPQGVTPCPPWTCREAMPCSKTTMLHLLRCSEPAAPWKYCWQSCPWKVNQAELLVAGPRGQPSPLAQGIRQVKSYWTSGQVLAGLLLLGRHLPPSHLFSFALESRAPDNSVAAPSFKGQRPDKQSGLPGISAAGLSQGGKAPGALEQPV